MLHIYLFVDKGTRRPVGFMRGNHQARLVPNSRKNRKFKNMSEISNRHRINLVGWRDFDEEKSGHTVFCTGLPCVGVDVACLHVPLADIFKAQAWSPYRSGVLTDFKLLYILSMCI